MLITNTFQINCGSIIPFRIVDGNTQDLHRYAMRCLSQRVPCTLMLPEKTLFLVQMNDLPPLPESLTVSLSSTMTISPQTFRSEALGNLSSETPQWLTGTILHDLFLTSIRNWITFILRKTGKFGIVGDFIFPKTQNIQDTTEQGTLGFSLEFYISSASQVRFNVQVKREWVWLPHSMAHGRNHVPQPGTTVFTPLDGIPGTLLQIVDAGNHKSSVISVNGRQYQFPLDSILIQPQQTNQVRVTKNHSDMILFQLRNTLMAQFLEEEPKQPKPYKRPHDGGADGPQAKKPRLKKSSSESSSSSDEKEDDQDVQRSGEQRNGDQKSPDTVSSKKETSHETKQEENQDSENKSQQADKSLGKGKTRDLSDDEDDDITDADFNDEIDNFFDEEPQPKSKSRSGTFELMNGKIPNQADNNVESTQSTSKENNNTNENLDSSTSQQEQEQIQDPSAIQNDNDAELTNKFSQESPSLKIESQHNTPNGRGGDDNEQPAELSAQSINISTPRLSVSTPFSLSSPILSPSLTSPSNIFRSRRNESNQYSKEPTQVSLSWSQLHPSKPFFLTGSYSAPSRFQPSSVLSRNNLAQYYSAIRKTNQSKPYRLMNHMLPSDQSQRNDEPNLQVDSTSQVSSSEYESDVSSLEESVPSYAGFEPSVYSNERSSHSSSQSMVSSYSGTNGIKPSYDPILQRDVKTGQLKMAKGKSVKKLSRELSFEESHLRRKFKHLDTCLTQVLSPQSFYATRMMNKKDIKRNNFKNNNLNNNNNPIEVISDTSKLLFFLDGFWTYFPNNNKITRTKSSYFLEYQKDICVGTIATKRTSNSVFSKFLKNDRSSETSPESQQTSMNTSPETPTSDNSNSSTDLNPVSLDLLSVYSQSAPVSKVTEKIDRPLKNSILFATSADAQEQYHHILTQHQSLNRERRLQTCSLESKSVIGVSFNETLTCLALVNDELHQELKEADQTNKDDTIQNDEAMPLKNKENSAKSKSSFLNLSGPLSLESIYSNVSNSSVSVNPIPLPKIRLGYSRQWVDAFPSILPYWEKVVLEPFAEQKNIHYCVLSNQNHLLEQRIVPFFHDLACCFQECKLGSMLPISLPQSTPTSPNSSNDQSFLREGILWADGDVEQLKGKNGREWRRGFQELFLQSLFNSAQQNMNAMISQIQNINEEECFIIYVIDPIPSKHLLPFMNPNSCQDPGPVSSSVLSIISTLQPILETIAHHTSRFPLVQVIGIEDIVFHSNPMYYLRTMAFDQYEKSRRTSLWRIPSSLSSSWSPSSDSTTERYSIQPPSSPETRSSVFRSTADKSAYSRLLHEPPIILAPSNSPDSSSSTASSSSKTKSMETLHCVYHFGVFYNDCEHHSRSSSKKNNNNNNNTNNNNGNDPLNNVDNRNIDNHNYQNHDHSVEMNDNQSQSKHNDNSIQNICVVCWTDSQGQILESNAIISDSNSFSLENLFQKIYNQSLVYMRARPDRAWNVFLCKYGDLSTSEVKAWQSVVDRSVLHGSSPVGGLHHICVASLDVKTSQQFAINNIRGFRQHLSDADAFSVVVDLSSSSKRSENLASSSSSLPSSSSSDRWSYGLSSNTHATDINDVHEEFSAFNSTARQQLPSQSHDSRAPEPKHTLHPQPLAIGHIVSRSYLNDINLFNSSQYSSSSSSSSSLSDVNDKNMTSTTELLSKQFQVHQVSLFWHRIIHRVAPSTNSDAATNDPSRSENTQTILEQMCQELYALSWMTIRSMTPQRTSNLPVHILKCKNIMFLLQQAASLDAFQASNLNSSFNQNNNNSDT